MADTPQWVSIVEGVGGALGAVSAAGVAALALVLQRRSNREERDRQARQQRDDRDAMRAAARSERIWEQRSDVYLDLLQALQPEAADSAAGKLQRMYDAAWPLRSRVHAFGSRDVVDAYSDFIVATREQLMRQSGTPLETDDVDEARKQLRMAIRISNGVDYADEFESFGPSPHLGAAPVANPVGPPPSAGRPPEPMPQAPWEAPPDLPGYAPSEADASGTRFDPWGEPPGPAEPARPPAPEAP
jgi:hypothetical protein